MLSKVTPTLVALVALLVVWEVYVWVANPSPSVLPAPSRVADQAVANWSDLWANSWATLQVAVLGFACSVAVSWIVASIAYFSPWFRQAITPLLVGSQAIPIIAIAPLMIMWFGFGLLPKILLIILVTFFPVTLGLIDGFASTPQGKTQLLQTMGATRWQQFRYLRVPHAMSMFFTSLKVAVTYAIVGTIFAEYAGAKHGLGIYMALQKNAFRTDLVLASVVMTAVLSALLFTFVTLLQRLVAPWTLAGNENHEPLRKGLVKMPSKPLRTIKPSALQGSQA